MVKVVSSVAFRREEGVVPIEKHTQILSDLVLVVTMLVKDANVS